MRKIVWLLIVLTIFFNLTLSTNKKNCNQCKNDVRKYLKSVFEKPSNPNELQDNLSELCSDSQFSVPSEDCLAVGELITIAFDAKGVCELLQACSSDWIYDPSHGCNLDECISTAALCSNICSCTTECTPECRQCVSDAYQRCSYCFSA